MGGEGIQAFRLRLGRSAVSVVGLPPTGLGTPWDADSSRQRRRQNFGMRGRVVNIEANR